MIASSIIMMSAAVTRGNSAIEVLPKVMSTATIPVQIPFRAQATNEEVSVSNLITGLLKKRSPFFGRAHARPTSRQTVDVLRRVLETLELLVRLSLNAALKGFGFRLRFRIARRHLSNPVLVRQVDGCAGVYAPNVVIHVHPSDSRSDRE